MKKPLVLIAAFIVSSLILYALVSRDQPATHSSLRVAALPPLIAMHELYATSNRSAQNLTPFVIDSAHALQQTEAAVDDHEPQLILPQTGSTSEALPAVVLIDSGSPGPDVSQTVRLLVNRGYAVLLIDCRNDAKTHSTVMKTGHEARLGCSEQSIAKEARDLVKRGIADPAALAISGSGSGAMLALMTMAAEEDLFQVAVVHSPAMIESEDHYAVLRSSVRERMQSGIQLIATTAQSPDVADKSLLRLIRSVEGGVLLIHGMPDTAHGLDQAAARALMAQRHNVKIYSIGLEDQNYSSWQTRVKVARLTEIFLARHLGGRNGGYDYIELLAKLF